MRKRGVTVYCPLSFACLVYLTQSRIYPSFTCCCYGNLELFILIGGVAWLYRVNNAIVAGTFLIFRVYKQHYNNQRRIRIIGNNADAVCFDRAIEDSSFGTTRLKLLHTCIRCSFGFHSRCFDRIVHGTYVMSEEDSTWYLSDAEVLKPSQTWVSICNRWCVVLNILDVKRQTATGRVACIKQILTSWARLCILDTHCVNYDNWWMA